MDQFVIGGGCLLLFCALLWIERSVMTRTRSAIPIRLAVLGTRGKTSVTRLIAAGLREAGLRVLAKTTGSEARIILPSGEERPVRRRGVNTPLEQRRILREAVRHRCDVVVLEAMSIRPESLRAEVERIIQPQGVVVTNASDDHIEEIPDPGRAFAEAIPKRSWTLLSSDIADQDLEHLRRRGIAFRLVDSAEKRLTDVALPHLEWPHNLALALAACERLGVSAETALLGMEKVRMDVGALAAWRVGPEGGENQWVVVNAFATNDPASAEAALRRSLEQWPVGHGQTIGLLNLRGDRADRTSQWMDAIDRFSDTLDWLLLCGAVPLCAYRKAARRYGNRVNAIHSRDPKRIMERVRQVAPEGGFVFGFGNIGGGGIQLVDYWREVGEPA